jgi:hypothetical protein
MLALAKAAMPLTLMLAAGKDGFESLYEEIFSGPFPQRGPSGSSGS